MKLTGLSNVGFDIPDIFTCHKDDEQPERMYLIGQDVRIFEIKTTQNSADATKFRIEFLKAPKTRPTKEIVNKNNMLAVYKRANILNRQTLGIDPLYAAEFSEANIEPIIQHICWPKKYVFKQKVIAAVTNFGQCDIIELNSISRTYEKTIISFNDLIEELFPNTVDNNFEIINKLVEDKVITCCCWIHTNENILLFSTISGWLFAASISETWTANLLCKIKTDFYKINRIKSFNFLNEENEFCTGIIVCDINGLIGLYQLKENSLEELCALWNNHDKMSSKQFDSHFDAENMELTISTIKGCHLLIFIVSTKNWTILYKGNEFCNAQIANFEKLSKFEYIVSTKIGQTKYITLTKFKEKYFFKTLNIPNDLEIENYTVCGMVASQNKIAFLFVMCPEKSFVLSRQRYASFISFCSFEYYNPIKILGQYNRKESDAKRFNDCYEIIRLLLTKNATEQNLHLYTFNPILIDWDLVHRLRIRYNIVHNIIAYNIKKTKTFNENYEIELNCIKFSIKAIYAYWRLLRIKKDFEKSDFQKLSAKCLRRILISFLNNEIFRNTAYEDLHIILTEMSKYIIEYLDSFCENILEICNFCGENTDEKNGICLHNIGRCCISNVQISSLEMKYCEGCGDIAIADETLLKQIIIDEYDVRCPICDYYLVK